MNAIARLAANQRADLFGETADRRGLSSAVVEKDFWVCWVLKQLFSIEAFSGRLLFKGGTSLSKISHAINRFSEDIDLAVDYAALGFTGIRDPRREGLSRTKQTKLLAEMLRDCQRYVGAEFIGEFRTRCVAALGPESNWRTAVDDRDPNVVRFHYPTAITARLAYISPQVVLELGTHAEFIPRDAFDHPAVRGGGVPQTLRGTRGTGYRAPGETDFLGKGDHFACAVLSGTRKARPGEIFPPLL